MVWCSPPQSLLPSPVQSKYLAVIISALFAFRGTGTVLRISLAGSTFQHALRKLRAAMGQFWRILKTPRKRSIDLLITSRRLTVLRKCYSFKSCWPIWEHWELYTCCWWGWRRLRWPPLVHQGPGIINQGNSKACIGTNLTSWELFCIA